MRNFVTALGCGALFGLGLAISQMAIPAKVLGFLDIAGNWDPSLLFVLGGAVTVTAIAFRFVLRLPKPVFDSSFETPPGGAIDARLLTGAGLFGIGWGLGGYCPGPGIVSLGRLAPDAFVFVAAFLVGSFAFRAMRRAGALSGTRADVAPTAARL
ncbi:MAG: membrane protein [Vulcanimicrobiaceae bacterium]